MIISSCFVGEVGSNAKHVSNDRTPLVVSPRSKRLIGRSYQRAQIKGHPHEDIGNGLATNERYAVLFDLSYNSKFVSFLFPS